MGLPGIFSVILRSEIMNLKENKLGQGCFSKSQLLCAGRAEAMAHPVSGLISHVRLKERKAKLVRLIKSGLNKRSCSQD